ncbi:MAG TPA: aminotransferase class I/II-fold pyridoxal phosphate-dependent enzyme, partial [Bryobacteraceae bacterium]|nr:aminotransferase class I/II-fold pyridoxal phosphate-dependent enzyme [Bryobacteraceae bacterium]
MSNALQYLTDQLESWRTAGTFQRLRELESPCEPISRFDHKEVINLASNNYLGLANHPKLVEAAIAATRRYGAGSGAVRTISGTMSLHLELEQRIAAFKRVEACVVFQSGFAANAGTVSAILGAEDHIISDALNHASIIDGCRLSRAKIHVFE